MSKNNRGIVAKRVVKHMKIGSADSTIGNLKLDLVVSTSWLFNFTYLDIPFATRVFDKSFHVGRSLNHSRQVQLTAAIDLSLLLPMAGYTLGIFKNAQANLVVPGNQAILLT
jgi:hypothetical protein